MAAVRIYTREQLLALRESPLVIKPDDLPAIEQWIDEAAATATNTRTAVEPTRRQQQRSGGSVGNDSATPMGSFSTGRPTLGQRSSTLRNQNGDDIPLGPPRTMFPSSRNIPKTSDFADKISADAAAGEDVDSSRSKFFNRRSLNEKEGRDPRDSWTTVRERRQRGEDGEDRGFGSRDHDSERNGHGERRDPRWTRDDRRQNGDRPAPGGWREREAARRQREEQEKEPEWLEDPVVKQDQELGFGVARTQDEFQKWKESMSKKTKGDDASAEVVEEAPAPPPIAETKPQVAPLKLDGFESSMFGWGGTPATTDGAPTPTPATAGPKPAAKSAKPSRFASMFKPVEPEPSVMSPAPEPTNGTAKTTAEDHEGFNRVLQMLGSTKLGQQVPLPAPQQQPPSSVEPASPPPLKAMTSNGTIKKSRFANMFEQKSPERLQSPQQGGPSLGGDSLFEGSSKAFQEEMQQVPQQHMFGGRLPERQASERYQSQQQQNIPRTQAPESTMSPDPSSANLYHALREQQPRPASGRHDLASAFDPPSRGAASPDVNIQNLLAQQRQQPQLNAVQGRQDLLSILTGNSSRPQSSQAMPNNAGGIDPAQVQRWIQQQQHTQGQNMPEPHAPKPRVPQQPPGLFEEQLMRNYPQDIPEPQRRSSQRAPPGFASEDAFLQQQQMQQQQQAQAQAKHQAQLRAQQQQQMMAQRQQQQPQRRTSAHPNLPHMQIPGQPPQPDFQQITSPMSAGGPPGFNPHAPRHPPGFQQHINLFQQQQQQQQREGPPPGFGGGMQSAPGNGPPPGFYGAPQMPPGFQINQIRSPVEQRPRGYDGYPEGMIPRR